jgi:hypothetical protein
MAHGAWSIGHREVIANFGFRIVGGDICCLSSILRLAVSPYPRVVPLCLEQFLGQLKARFSYSFLCNAGMTPRTV